MKKSKKDCDLHSCSFCQGCLKDWLPALAESRETWQVNKGETFFKEGDQVSGIFFVYEGAVKVHKRWGDKELIVRFAKKGDIVGHRGLGGDEIYPVSATALEPALICFVSKEFFLSSLKVNQDYLFKLTMFLAEELRVSERKMRNLAHMPVKGRVAQALLNLQEKFGEDAEGFINLTLSRQDLASYTGATYETVFRTLNDMSEENLVRFSGKRTAILDRTRLLAITGLPH